MKLESVRDSAVWTLELNADKHAPCKRESMDSYTGVLKGMVRGQVLFGNIADHYLVHVLRDVGFLPTLHIH